jgi:integrase
MASVFKRSRDRKRPGASWYIAYADERGIRRTVKGCPDKAATEGMARKLESEADLRRRGVIDPKADAYKENEARSLADHLDDFRTMLHAKNGTAKHASVTRNRAGRVIDLAGFRYVSDLSLSKALDALASLRAEGLGGETINHHVRAVKAFSRWLWKDGRAREHHLAHLATANPEADRRRRRRALTHEEAARLIQAAERGPFAKGMTGPDRARCYALALGTGFRASELASLTPERFDMTANPPTATVPAAYTKNGREAVQPLPTHLAERLAPWLATLTPGRPIFKMPDRTAEMIRVDLKVALIEYETSSGFADFHSLRGVYISNLVASGASVKTCQVLARHSTPSLTIGLYAKASLHDIKGAVAGLPDPIRQTSTPEAARLAATGTDPDSALTAQGQRAGDGLGRNASVAVAIDDENNDSHSLSMMDRKSHDFGDLDVSCRSETAPVVNAGGGSRTHMREAPRRILSPLRLPFRHAGAELRRKSGRDSAVNRPFDQESAG